MRSRSCPRSQRRSKPRRARADRTEAEELVAERVVRRRERDFAAADAIRERLRAGAGEVVVLFDPGVELTGDAITPLLEALGDPTVVVVGPFGLRGKGTLKEFEEDAGPDVDAIEGYCMAFRRSDAEAVEGFDPKFKFYRIADIEFSFRLRDRGG